MRVEDKAVDGLELERERDRELTPLEREEDELPENARGEVAGLSRAAGSDVLSAIQAILDGDRGVEVAKLNLPEREARALEALQAAVTGKQPGSGMFVFAEDRENMLEQALAVLQPMLTRAEPEVAAAFARDHDRITTQVTDLRAWLITLESAQEELFPHAPAAAKAGTPDTADKPGGKPGETTLTGGPEVKREPAKTTLTGGPEVEREPAKTTLTGGSEAKRAEAPTTLGDAKEIAAAQAQLPWWKRRPR